MFETPPRYEPTTTVDNVLFISYSLSQDNELSALFALFSSRYTGWEKRLVMEGAQSLSRLSKGWVFGAQDWRPQ
ncbi:hypothetical protein ES703_88234 [subsurface metagenome]